MPTLLRIINVVHFKRGDEFLSSRRHLFSFSLGILVISQRTSRVNFLKTIQRISFEILCAWPTRYFYIDIIVCSIVYRTEISMKYFDAPNTFPVGGMNFNRVYKEVSKDIPFILVPDRCVMWRWTSIFADVLPFADKYTPRFPFSCPC